MSGSTIFKRFALAIVLCALVAPASVWAAGARFVPNPANPLQTTGKVTVSVKVTDVGTGVIATDLDIYHDPAVLKVITIAPGSGVPGGSTFTSAVDTKYAGYIGLGVQGSSSFTPTTGDVEVAVITFEVITPCDPSDELHFRLVRLNETAICDETDGDTSNDCNTSHAPAVVHGAFTLNCGVLRASSSAIGKVGGYVTVPVTLSYADPGNPISGINMIVYYDSTRLTYQRARLGPSGAGQPMNEWVLNANQPVAQPGKLLLGFHWSPAQPPQGAALTCSAVLAYIDFHVTGGANHDTAFVNISPTPVDGGVDYHHLNEGLIASCVESGLVTLTTETCNGVDDDSDGIIDNGGDALCDNGNWCDGAEVCAGTSGCRSATTLQCDDGFSCTTDTCTESTRTCTNTPVDANCNDSNLCTADVCNPSGVGHGTDGCIHTAYSCDDLNPCTTDACDGLGGCSYTNLPLNTACPDDGNVCTNDICDGAGACTHPNKTSGTACTTDSNVCTDDVCNGSGLCTHPNNTASCTDNLYCNGTDTCSGGNCAVHSGNPCTTGQLCNESTDQCCSANRYSLPDPEMMNWFTDLGWQPRSKLVTKTLHNPGVDFTIDLGDTSQDKLGVGNNYPVNGAAAGLAWDTGPGGRGEQTSLAGYGSYQMKVTYVSGPTGSDIDLKLHLNTGITGPTGNPANNWMNDTYWGGNWINLSVGQSAVAVHNFDSAEAWNVPDNPSPHSGAGLGWQNGQQHAINDRDRHEITNIGFEVNDFDDDARLGNIVIRLEQLPSGCLIDNVCYSNGQANPANECQICDAQTSATAWTNKADQIACTADSNECTNDVCLSGVCSHPNKAEQTPCTADAFECTNDWCVSGVCSHPNKTNGTSCGTAPGTCENQDTCQNGVCNDAGYKSSSTVCRTAAGECDAAEYCTGSSATCPADAKKPLNTACTDDTNPCTRDICDGSGNTCTHPAGNAGTLCRAASGQCDVAEYCTGSSTSCPADGFASSSTSCTGTSQGGLCDNDAADHCFGTTNTCVDVFKTVGTTCRPAAGDCDVAETCSGTSGACPADGKKSVGTVCLAGTLPCDPDDTCDGTTNACAAKYAPEFTTCGDPDATGCNAADSCNATGTCVDRKKADDTPCDDTLYCTVDDKCTSGVCVGTARDCSGLNDTCNVGTCNETADVCQKTPANEGVACDDGLFCTTGEKCASGSCTGGTPTDCSAQNDQCNVGTCNETTNACEKTPSNENGTCDDTLYCTVNDKCTAGVCAGAPRDCSGLNDACNVGTCNETADACQKTPANEGVACDDGLFCTTGEKCASGSCTGGTPTDCSAQNDQCNVGTCNETTNACEKTPSNENGTCDDTLYCTVNDKCTAGVCAGAPRDCSGLNDACNVGTCNETADACQKTPANEGVACDDGLFCTTGEKCASGSCTGGTPTDCSAQNDQCNVGTCNETTNACEKTPSNENGTCDDTLYCTVNDKCTAGVCAGAPRDCSGLNDACNVGTCNETADACQKTPANEGVACDDGLFCTTGEKCASGSCTGGTPTDCSAQNDQCNVGTCNETTNACEKTPSNENGTCDDTLYCTVNDKCTAGVCAGAPRDCSGLNDACNVGTCNETADACQKTPANEGVACDDGLFCTTGEKCASGSCTGGTPTDCSAQNDQCNVGTCNETTNACEKTPSNENGTCDDTLYCTVNDKCTAGVCAGAPRDCSGLNDACNVGTCNETADACQKTPANEGVACDDGLFCTTGEKCASGSCTGGTPTDCSAQNDQCNVGTCNETTNACEKTPSNENGTCDDTLYCTVNDKCTAGVCAGAPRDCSGLNDACNVGTCNETADACQKTPANEGVACDDGLFCTTGEKCASGSCTGGTPTDCSAQNDQCNVGTCNETTNACEKTPSNENGTCDDTLYCTVNDKCTAGVCAGAPRDCSGLNDACNVGTCNETADACQKTPANEGVACDDGLFCTTGEKCASGSCTGGTPTDCSAQNDQCNVGTCNETTNACEKTPSNENGTCDDTLYCTVNDKCTAGVCAGAPRDCSGLNDTCNVGTCNETADACQKTPANEGVACDDGLFCTTGEKCASGSCTGGTPTDCSAQNDQCNAGTCNETTNACEKTPSNENGTCNDTLYCTVNDKCTAGVCAGAPRDCSGLNDACNVGTCNETADACQKTPANEGAACTDGQLCTYPDRCLSGTCTGTPYTCNDGDVCTTDTCNGTGGCVYSVNGLCGVSGTALYYRNNGSGGSEPSSKPVPNVSIDDTNDGTADAVTDNNGQYAFGNLDGNVTVATLRKYGTPRASDHNGAITSYDATLIAQSAVHLITLTDNQKWAGDATGDGSVTSYDASFVAQFAVQLIDHLPISDPGKANSDWKFFKACTDPTPHTCGDPIYNYTPISGPQAAGFYALLYGDVSGNWVKTGGFAPLVSGPENEAALNDQLEAQRLGAQLNAFPAHITRTAPASMWMNRLTGRTTIGAKRVVYVTVQDADGILAFDMNLTYDPSLISILDVATLDVGSGLNLVKNDHGGSLALALYGIQPLRGSGRLLAITVESRANVLPMYPLTISAQANEGQIPLQMTFGPKIKAIPVQPDDLRKAE